MDYHCLFKDDQRNYGNDDFWRGVGKKFHPQPCPFLNFEHTPEIIKMERGALTDADALTWLHRDTQSLVHSRLRILMTPSRHYLDKNKKAHVTNPEAPIPFTQETFNKIVNDFHLHKGFFKKHRHCQVAKIAQDSVASFYVETSSHRDFWFKVFVSFDEVRQMTTVIIHNLLATELDYIEEKFNEKGLHCLTIHPLFVFVLIMDLLFREIVYGTRVALGDAVRLKLRGALHTEERFKHLQQENFNVEEEVTKALGNEQNILGLLEKTEFAIKMGTKIILWFGDLDCSTLADEQKTKFNTAGEIIRSRFEYLVDGLNFQLLRLRRAQSHSQLNRSGLESRNTTLGNSLNYGISEQNYRIAEQSRDIARDSKRDPSAMKAIAVLTMVFLPGTFVAAFFAMPLFDWQAPAHAVLSSRFWIYWAVTIPATAMVLVVWRIWFVFEEWRQYCGREGKIYSDFGLWVRSARRYNKNASSSGASPV
ncbi:hypothetical protein BKA64DRAFT_708005 [Cadophora sp. MPI-SDFR-AT-0126]|nr:hypothetical protein BKA64DRAFT_708005 [Leotiomycetes sp. MPI-SDFR-AT-0126]